MKFKSEVFGCLVECVNECENLTGKNITCLRCDNGKEYLNSNSYKFAKERGIVNKNYPAYCYELNRTAEKFNRTIMNMSRCLLEIVLISILSKKSYVIKHYRKENYC